MQHADKDQLVWQFSDSKTNSLQELYVLWPLKYAEMIDYMTYMVGTGHGKNASQEVKKYRSAVLKRLQQYGIDTTDWSRVNQFLSQKRIAGKRLYEMNVDEMKALVKKLESILRKNEEEAAEEHRLSLLN